ncbi:carbohydrate ABC transporter permease [Alteribacillus bidgolensis]|uniref:Carbohydrate ABC transporter membrane protein 1, CUT1 family n=1 Tax=Alteribacillus bidgolensis TaxID=930129 RepID=A0A1G8K8J5_9BACI|nr:sugar ABC transporter permease [Alteribacillus bidgolensis]SDI39689.1 carbohydrate ABC transporter membrane protein 1, CUT1 family [Alteribacillus bidgolensis]
MSNNTNQAASDLQRNELPAKKPKKSKTLQQSDKKLPFLLLTPTFILLAAVTIFPILYALYVSVMSFDTFGNSSGFTGLKNYMDIFASSTFWNAIFITLLYTGLAVSIEIFLGFNLALMVSKDGKAMTYLRWLLIIPMMLSPLVVAVVYLLMMNTDMGILNYMLQSIGLPKINFLGEPTTAFLSLIFVDVWQWMPMCFLIILAGLQALPRDPFEAAEIDGASKLQVVRFVTLPMLKPILVVALVIRTMDALRTFDQVFVLTQGGPGRATETISFLMYRASMKNSDFGFASAGLFIVLIITIIISTMLIRFMNRSQSA